MNTPEILQRDPFSYKTRLNRPGAFLREDESDDRLFYARERMLPHLDSLALRTVEQLIEALIPEKRPLILDLMSSFDSHIPESVDAATVVGLGLNRKELKANPALTDIVIHDLNAQPGLPFSSRQFDVVLNTVSVDYLTRPREVFKEVGRVLKPGGLFLVVFSNRMFLTKATRVWKELTEEERVNMVKEFFIHSGMFENPEFFASIGKPRPKDDRWAHYGIPSDPIYALYADRLGGNPEREPRPRFVAEYGDRPDPEELKRRMERVKDTHECPYCLEKMAKWDIGQNDFTTYDHPYMYVCVNDACSYLVRGYDQMFRQGALGLSYRAMYNPKNDRVTPVPIPNLNVIKSELVDEDD